MASAGLRWDVTGRITNRKRATPVFSHALTSTACADLLTSGPADEHGRRDVTSSETGVDIQFRQRLLDAMVSLLTRLLEPDKPVTPDMRLMDELGLSSSLALELLLELEEQLEIQIDVELMDPDQMTTVEDLATFIAGHSRPM